MLNIPSSADAVRLRSFFSEAGYTQGNVGETLGISELPSTRLRNLPHLLDLTRESNLINTLLRLFWVGVPQDVSEVLSHVPPWFAEMSLTCNLLHNEGKQFVPQVMVVPFESMLIVSDHTSRLDSSDSDLVLWPNPTSRLLSRFTVRRPSAATLDVGTGTGIQALMAASHSEAVIATDLNIRALTFASFNARLNGIENVEFLFGDGLEPVADRKFDLIVSNPPFFITPSDDFLFCDNPWDLDQLCRRLAREAAIHLNEGGYFQMLCEWAEIRGQSWQERIAEWFKGIECDVWIIKGQTRDPSKYAQDRIREVTSSSGTDADLYRSYMDYYRARNVQAIHDGIIAMRRRSGQNWVLVEEITHTPKDPFGDWVLTKFSAQDFLQAHSSDERMLGIKPIVSPLTRLEQIFERGNVGWKPLSLTLRLAKGFSCSVGVQPLVGEFLGQCNGQRSLRELIADFATKVNAPVSQVQTECLAVVRTLIGHGFVLLSLDYL